MKIKLTLLLLIHICIASLAFAQSPLQWEELGPKNTGGRTRAILVDKRDSTRATVYAGMVSGGLWKSTDRGSTWHLLLSAYTCAAVSCIAQDANGRIYFGTGEGFAEPGGTSRNSGSVGNGLHFLYGNDQDSIIPSTMPAYLSNSLSWCMINRIAINPTNPQDIYVATSNYGSATSGLEHSTDGGQTWTIIGSAAAPISGLTSGYAGAGDVKFSSDGNNIFASVGMSNGVFPGYELIISNDGGNTFYYVPDTTFAASIWRIEIAVAPSNPHTAYLSIASSGGGFGGVWQTTDDGNDWTQIGTPAGILSSVFGTDGQGWFDNAIAVNPKNPNQIYLGGVQLYSYSYLTSWSLASVFAGGTSNPQWIHEDMQTIVFNDLDSDEMYIGCDGGIFKSTNANSGFPTPYFAESNTGYNTVQNYSVGADLYGDVLGGTESDGTVYVEPNIGSQNVYAGDGVYAEISHFDSTIFIGGYVSGAEYRSNTKGSAWVGIFDAVIDPGSQGVPSVCGLPSGDAAFVTAFWLAETKNATNSISSIPFVDNVSHSAGDIVTITSHIGYTFQDTLSISLPAGDTAYITDRLQSRLYFATVCGLWMTPDILNFNGTPRWFRLTSTSGDIKSLTVSPTGDTIYFANANSVERMTGLNSVLAFDTALTGHNDILLSSGALFTDTTFSVTGGVGGTRYIEGIDMDRNNPNHVLCAIAGFTAPGTPHVYASTDAGMTWAPVHNNLPDMPVYQCVIDAYNSNHYIVGSELGFWDSYDAGTTWTEQNGGIVVREPIYRLRQQNYLSDQCYVLYAGIHGRGMWRCATITAEQANCPVAPLGISNDAQQQSAAGMTIYPNPMDGAGKVTLELDQLSDVTLRIVDMTGRVLQEATYNHLNEGTNTLDLNASALADGSYIVVARLSSGQTFTKTLIVAR